MAITTRSATTSQKKRATPATPTPTEKKPRAKIAAKPRGIDARLRQRYIEVAAYYIAERRGFAAGHEAEDWASAETEIDRLLAADKFND